jgi:urease accessory protein
MTGQHWLYAGIRWSRSRFEPGARTGAVDGRRRAFAVCGLPLIIATLLVVLLPSEGHAHHAEWMKDQPFVQGLSMPVHSVDHMLVAVGVGLIAVQLGGSALLGIPSLFALLMCIGALLNAHGIAVPLLEQGMLASMLVLGAILARQHRVSFFGVVIAVSMSAAIQGYALLGSTPPTSVNWLIRFAAGCVISAVALLGSGMGLGLLLQRLRSGGALRYAGGAIIATGVVVYFFPSANDVVLRLLE